MSKANQKARFSIVSMFDPNFFRMNKLDRALRYLDYDEIIAKIPRVKQAFRDIKARKREEHLGRFATPNKKAKKSMNKFGISDQIQHGFDVAKGWKDAEAKEE